MSGTEIQALRSAAKQRHRDRIAESDSELRYDLAAIERVAKLQQLPVTPANTEEPDQHSFNHGDLQTVVRKAVDSCSKARFTAAAIRTQIREGDPSINGTLTQKAVSGVLKRLVALQEVKVRRPGKGRRATIYAKGGDDS